MQVCVQSLKELPKSGFLYVVQGQYEDPQWLQARGDSQVAGADLSEQFCLKGQQGCALFLWLVLLPIPSRDTAHSCLTFVQALRCITVTHSQLCPCTENSCPNPLLHCFAPEPQRWVSSAAKAGRGVIQHPLWGRKNEGILMNLNWLGNSVYPWILFLWRCWFEGNTLQSLSLNLIS